MRINSNLTRNRAEEYGFDLWNEFVIPPYYSQLELMKSEKPQIIEGGRGSGKTMLIRYLCHTTQFSPKRQTITEADYKRVGIYWKMDVQFSKLMSMRGADETLWLNAFINMGVLVLTKEIIESLYNIKSINPIAGKEIDDIDFGGLQDFDPLIPSPPRGAVAFTMSKRVCCFREILCFAARWDALISREAVCLSCNSHFTAC